MMQWPLLIVFEGLDGAGKSTACETLLQAASRHGINAKIVKTPGPLSAPLCFSLRGSSEIGSLLAFAIGNFEAVSSSADVDIIIADRYMLSTLVHHAHEFEISPDFILGVLKALGAPRPAMTILLDVTLQLAQRRLAKRLKDRALLVPLADQQARFRSLLVDSRINFLIGEGLTLDEFGDQHATDLIIGLSNFYKNIRPA